MREIEVKIRDTIKQLFYERKIDIFIGYNKGSLPLRSTPCFVTELSDIENLIWNSYCYTNLAVYLPRFFPSQSKGKAFPRVGILAKGCDARSLVGLIKEKQVPRENIYILGVICDGIIDLEKIQDTDIVDSKERNDKIIITYKNGKEAEIKKGDLLTDACVNCHYTTPTLYDTLIIGKENQKLKTKKQVPVIDQFENKSIQERWEYFQEQMSKCIRCYACRQACPNCYCKECFAEQTKPKWIGNTNNISDIMFYQIGRIFHQAGRCVDCGACVRACPMGIDLRIFTYKLVKDTKEFFGYEAGLTIEELPPLATFKLEDQQEFITEP